MAKIHMLEMELAQGMQALGGYSPLTGHNLLTVETSGCSDPGMGALRLLWFVTGVYLNPGRLHR